MQKATSSYLFLTLRVFTHFDIRLWNQRNTQLMGFLAYFFLPLGPADCGYGSSCCGRSAGEPRITPHWFCTCAMLSIVGCLVMCMKQMCEFTHCVCFLHLMDFFQDVPFSWIIEMLRCLTPSLWIIPLVTARFKRDSQIDGLRSQGAEIDFSHLICQYLMGLISGEQVKKRMWHKMHVHYHSPLFFQDFL